MIVNVVRLARLVNTGDYENTRVEVEAILDEDEDPEEVAAQVSALLVRMIAAERRRRYPDPAEWAWRPWLTRHEDPDWKGDDVPLPAPSTDLSSSG